VTQKTDAPVAPVEAAVAACLEPYVALWQDPERAPGRAVLDVLARAIERHRDLITEAGLSGSPPSDWHERAERLLAYRRGIDTDMLGRLIAMYRDQGPTRAVEEGLKQAGERCVGLCQELPNEVSAPWPEDALAPKPSDSFGRRAGKVVARLFSAARKAGKERPLPLRDVAAHHLAESVAPAADQVGTDALAAWGEWSRELENAWVDWGRATLPSLVRAEVPDDDQEEVADLWSTISEAAEGLQTRLGQLLESPPTSRAAARSEALLGVARGCLEADLAVAGSFLYRPDTRAPSAPLRRVPQRVPVLMEWDQGVQARLRLYSAILSILSGTTAVQRKMVYRIRDRCLSGRAGLREIAARLDELAVEVDGPTSFAGDRVEELDRTVDSILEPTKDAVPQPAAVDVIVRDVSDDMVDALGAMIRQAPSTLMLHSVTARVPTGSSKAEARPLPLQELARQAFDALRVERIRSSTSGLVAALDEARTQLSEVAGVYAFARDEALRELETAEEDAKARADDLLSGALRSIAEGLRNQVTNLDTAVQGAQDRLASEISEGSAALLDRVGAGRMEARLFAARSRAAELRAWLNDKWGPPVERAARYIRARFQRLRRLGARAVRKGSAIVGAGPGETAASTRTLRALADIRAQTEGLPLVYQRLFTLEPISDMALLAGRETQLSDAMARWRRWHDSDGVPLVVRGRQGSGITSFLKVLAAHIEEDGGSVLQAAFDHRITGEPELAEQLAELLGLERVDSLDSLAHMIFEVDASKLPAAVALDNLEHLYLRVPKGTDLTERLLTLIAETEPRIFWIVGITASAWQLIAAAEPTAVSQVDVFDLPPLTAQAMRSAMTMRHRRSGLAIRYEEPTSGRIVLRRRLRRMRDAEGYQQLLEEDFFDRLYKASGGHLSLALYQWLLSADFTSGDGVLMKQPERPDFSVLEALDLTQNFTLKAFLEHRSLSLAEHDAVFRLPRHESYQIFESLRNRHLIEPLPKGDESIEARSEIEEELRYRVRPLLLGTVIAHLQGRNIVH